MGLHAEGARMKRDGGKEAAPIILPNLEGPGPPANTLFMHARQRRK
jgi:hypothetical protein